MFMHPKVGDVSRLGTHLYHVIREQSERIVDTVPLGMLAAFLLKLPVPAVYLVINLDEMIKLPAVYRHYKKYKWVKNLTVKGEMQNE